MPLQQTSGAASYDAFGGGVAAVPKYIEDYFSTFVYTGNNSTNAINNGIDLSTKGGLIWTKGRSAGLAGVNHWLSDTARGIGYSLASDSTAAQAGPYSFITLGTGGYSLNTTAVGLNTSGETYASWSWAKAPKFFDVVTYTGTGSVQNIAHNLGSVPGCIIVKRTNASGSWRVYHRSLTSAAYMVELNTSSGEALDNASWNSTAPTSTVFTVGSDAFVNASGGTYVAYLFAHNAAGFGLLGTDNVISCGSFTTNGSGVASVNLGYEPQWVVTKAIAGGTGSWFMQDNMRGFTANPTVYTANPLLKANDADPEATFGAATLQANSTGFTTASATYDPSVTYIYIAIRRGPMKVPTSGTSVFSAQANIASDAVKTTTGFVTDWFWERPTYNGAGGFSCSQRLTQTALFFINTAAEGGPYGAGYLLFDYNNGFLSNLNGNINPGLMYGFKRAPSFFDVVCYTGNGGINNVQNHSLADSIGMLIIKRRDSTGNWSVFVKESGGNYSYWNSSGTGTGQGLNGTGAPTGTNYSGYNSYLTSTTFNAAQIAGSNDINANGGTYVAYLFATCAGVSKVGSYTGDNSDGRIIDCGFTAGARFILIRRTDQGGQWAVWDSARGIVSGSDPYLMLNNTLAEVAGYDDVDVHSTGFIINASSPGIPINVAGSTYIFLAIA